MAGRVQVVAPDGTKGSIPTDSVSKAEARGYKVVAPPPAPDIPVGDRIEDFAAGRVAEGVGAIRGLGEAFGVGLDEKVTGDADTLDDAAQLFTGERTDAGGYARDFLTTAKEEHPFESGYGHLGGVGLGIFLGGKTSAGHAASPIMAAEEAAGNLVARGAKALGVGEKVASGYGVLEEGSLVGRAARGMLSAEVRGEVGMQAMTAVDSINDQALKDGDISMGKTLAAMNGALGYGAIGGVVVGGSAHGLGNLSEALIGAYRKGAGEVADIASKSAGKAVARETRVAGPPSVILGDAMTEEGVAVENMTAKGRRNVARNVTGRYAASVDGAYEGFAADAQAAGVAPKAQDIVERVAQRVEELRDSGRHGAGVASRIARGLEEFEAEAGLSVSRSKIEGMENLLRQEQETLASIRSRAAEQELPLEGETRIAAAFRGKRFHREAIAAAEEREATLVREIAEAKVDHSEISFSPKSHAKLRETLLREDPALHDELLDKYFKDVKSTAGKMGDEAREAFDNAESHKAARDHWTNNIGDTPPVPRGGGGMGDLLGRRSGAGSIVGGIAGGAIGHAAGGMGFFGSIAGSRIGQAAERHFTGGGNTFGSPALKKIAVWAEAQRRSTALDAEVGKAVKGFFNTTGRTAMVAPMIFLGHGEERDKKVKEFSDHLSALVSDPKAMAAHIEKSTGDLPEHSATQAAAAQSRIAANLQALHARLPKPTSRTSYPFSFNRVARYADQDIMAFERYMATTQDPLTALEAMQNNALTQEHVDAMHDVHPDVIDEVFRAAYHHGKDTDDMQKRVQLFKLFQIPVGDEFEESAIANRHDMLIADANKAQEGAQGNGSPGKPGNISKTGKTPASRLEEVK